MELPLVSHSLRLVGRALCLRTLDLSANYASRVHGRPARRLQQHGHVRKPSLQQQRYGTNLVFLPQFGMTLCDLSPTSPTEKVSKIASRDINVDLSAVLTQTPHSPCPDGQLFCLSALNCRETTHCCVKFLRISGHLSKMSDAHCAGANSFQNQTRIEDPKNGSGDTSSATKKTGWM